MERVDSSSVYKSNSSTQPLLGIWSGSKIKKGKESSDPDYEKITEEEKIGGINK